MNVEVMYSVYFKKRQSAANPSFRIPHSLRGVGPDGPYGPEADFRIREM
jgi:hypothetical protein